MGKRLEFRKTTDFDGDPVNVLLRENAEEVEYDFNIEWYSRNEHGEKQGDFCDECLGQKLDMVDISDENAQRLVACWNACEGIEDPCVIHAFTAAVRRLRYNWNADARTTADLLEAVDIFLAKMEGRK